MMKWWKLIFKVTFSLVLIYALTLKVSFETIAASLSVLTPTFFCILLAFHVLAIAVNSYRTKILFKGISFGSCVILNFVGVFYSTILPGQVSGELAKWSILRKSENSAGKRLLADKFYGLIGLFATGLVGVIFSAKVGMPTAISILLGAIGALSIVVATYSINWFFLKGHGSFSKLESLVLVFTAIFYQIAAATSYFLISQRLNLNLSFAEWLWISGCVSLSLLPPITIAGLGLRDFSLIGILSFFGIASESAVSISLSLFSIVMFLALGGGLMELLRANGKLTIRRVYE